jgi:hypothetical protein
MKALIFAVLICTIPEVIGMIKDDPSADKWDTLDTTFGWISFFLWSLSFYP